MDSAIPIPSAEIGITVVIPMKDEEAHVAPTVAAATHALQTLDRPFEIVCVDDGSRDDTLGRLKALAAGRSDLRVVHHDEARGLGGALRAGFCAARGSLVFYTDADLPIDFMELHRAVRLLEERDADLLCGWRLDRSGEGLGRQLISAAYNTLYRLGFGVRIRDVNFAFKVLRREWLAVLNLRSEGSFIDGEMVAKMHRSGARILQMGLDYFPRQVGASRLAGLRHVLRLLGEARRQWREIRSLRPRSAPRPPRRCLEHQHV